MTEHEKLIIQYVEYFNGHEWDKIADLYSEIVEFKDPSLGVGVVKQRKQQIIDRYAGMAEIFPDLRDEIIQIYSSGEKHIIVEFVSTGTAPDGSKLELPICAIFTVENGKITKDFSYFDNFEDPTTNE